MTQNIPMTTELAQGLVAKHFPQWTHLPVQKLDDIGTDNWLFRMGDTYLLRYPKDESASKQLLKEFSLLQKLCPKLPIKTPTPVALKEADNKHSFPLGIYYWIEGVPYTPLTLQHDFAAVETMVNFIVSLQQIDPEGGAPPGPSNNFRGVPLAQREKETQQYLQQFPSHHDSDLLSEIWGHLKNAPVWDKPLVWIHGDLHWGNVLTRSNAIVGIIDFGALGLGDPATDLMSAWIFFDHDARQHFKSLINVDAATWARGAGWALSFAIIALPYYLPKKHVLTDIAEHTLSQVIHDYKNGLLQY